MNAFFATTYKIWQKISNLSLNKLAKSANLMNNCKK